MKFPWKTKCRPILYTFSRLIITTNELDFDFMNCHACDSAPLHAIALLEPNNSTLMLNFVLTIRKKL